MAANAHGRAVAPRDSAPPAAGAAAPAARPQRWQNLAPGVSGARQPPQSAPSTGAPHCAQNRPSTWAEQLGQVVERGRVGVMPQILTAEGAGRRTSNVGRNRAAVPSY